MKRRRAAWRNCDIAIQSNRERAKKHKKSASLEKAQDCKQNLSRKRIECGSNTKLEATKQQKERKPRVLEAVARRRAEDEEAATLKASRVHAGRGVSHHNYVRIPHRARSFILHLKQSVIVRALYKS